MKTFSIPASAALAACLLLAATSPAQAHDDHGQDDAPSPLGPHPAIVVQRLHAAGGYDYASKFYPHPAGLALLSRSPHAGSDPAFIPDREGGPAPARRAGPARLRTRIGRDDVGSPHHVR
jgi:hypothetical protein